MSRLRNSRIQYKARIPMRNVGIAIMIAFFLVTMLFITLYIASGQYQGRGHSGTDKNGGQSTSGDHLGSDGSQQPGQEDPAIGTGTGNTPDPPGAYQPGEPGDGPTGGDPVNDPNNPTDIPSTGGAKVAYLTFDDGPERDITPRILDILLAEDIKATFFVLPYQGVDDLYQRIIDEGHELGNHTYTHVYERLYDRTVDDFRRDVRRAHDFIEENFGYTMTSFRFPGGVWRAGNGLSNRIDVIQAFGYRHYQWHVDPEDWRRNKSAEDITKDILDNTAGREHVIILMHDYVHSQATLEALPEIIKGLREQGYTFDTAKNFPPNIRTGLSNSS